MTRPDRRRLPNALRVLRHRALQLVVLGNLVSQLGTWAQYVGIGWAARELTNSTFVVAVAFASPFAASLFLSPVTGVIADRYDRRTVVIWASAAMAVPPFAVGLLLQHDALNVTLLIALVFLGGIGQAVVHPAALALIPELVPADELQQAIALNSGVLNASRIVGPAIGGFAISTWGLGWAFHLDALSFFAVVVAWALVHTKANVRNSSAEGFVATLRGGLAYARLSTTVGPLLVLTAMATFCVMHAPLMPVIVRDLLHGNASTYALLSAAPGVGSVFGAMVAGEMTTARSRQRSIGAGALTVALSLLALSVSRIAVVSGACLVLFGFGYFVMSTSIMTIVSLTSRADVRGRVMGLLSMTSAGMIPVNALAAGLLASVIGPSWTVGVAASTLLAFSTWFIVSGKIPLAAAPTAADDTRPASLPAGSG